MFRAALRKVVDPTPGCVAGLIMGFDGIRVEHYLPDAQLHGAQGNRADVRDVGAELSVLITRIRAAIQLLELGTTHQCTIRTDKLTTIVHVIDVDYFVLVTVAPGGNAAKAGYLIQIAAQEIRTLLE